MTITVVVGKKGLLLSGRLIIPIIIYDLFLKRFRQHEKNQLMKDELNTNFKIVLEV